MYEHFVEEVFLMQRYHIQTLHFRQDHLFLLIFVLWDAPLLKAKILLYLPPKIKLIGYSLTAHLTA